jgi:two-component system, sensor histidine kinase and response regulator
MIHPITGLLVGIQWITTYLLVHHLALWLGRRDQRLHLWVAAWCAVAATHQGGRMLHYQTTDPATALLAVQVSAAAVALSGVVGICAIRSLTGNREPSAAARVLIGCSVLLAALVLTTPWFFDMPTLASTWTDPVGREVLWVPPGDLQLVWFPWGIGCLAYTLRCVHHAEGLPRVERQMVMAAIVIYVSGGLVDALVGWGLNSILLFEFSFAAIAIGFDFLTVRRFSELQGTLAQRVDERTKELRQTVGLLGAALETAEDASSARARFLANVSHEVRTPLNGLLGMTQLLARTRLTPGQKQMVQTAQSSAESVLDVVNDVLDLSKVDAGGLTLDVAPLDFGAAVEEAAAVFAAEAQRRGLEMACLLPEGRRLKHEGDVLRFGQIVRNLLGNALKFTYQGRIVVEVTVEPEGDGIDRIVVAVTDSGIGVAASDQERIFDAFTQAGADPMQAAPGTGLGLAIGSRLAGLMGGQLSIESQLGCGSTFSLSLPARRLSERSTERSALKGLRGLLVAGEGVTREAVSRQVRSFGVDLTVSTLEDAADTLAERGPFRLAVTILPSLKIMNEWVAGDAHGRLESARVPQTLLLPATLGFEAGNLELAPSTGSILYPALSNRLAEAIRDAAWGGMAEDSVASTPGPAAVSIAGCRVLVIEDSPVNQQVAVAMLAELGLEADALTGGEEAVERAVSGYYSAVLMDCQMPGMDGFEATRRIRAAEGEGRVPILAMTAHALPAQRRLCLDAGMDGFLTKPVRFDQLEEALLPWLLGEAITERAPSVEEEVALDVERARLVLELVTRRGLDPEQTLVEPFSNGRSALRRALAARDDLQLREAAHTIAGAAANLGASAVHGCCQEVGRLVRSGDRWATALAVDELDDAIEGAVEGLRRLLREAKVAPA